MTVFAVRGKSFVFLEKIKMQNDRKLWLSVLTVAVGLLFSVLYYVWFSHKMEQEREYKNSPAGLAEIQGDIDIRKMKQQLELERERRKILQIEQRHRPVAERVSQSSLPSAAPRAETPACQQVFAGTGFLNPVKPPAGGCLASSTEYVWVRFDTPPKEVSGAAKLSVIEELPRASPSDDRRIHMRETCQGDFLRCAQGWVGEMLLIQRAPGRQLMIRS